MRFAPIATSCIGILVADSNPMQSQLLTGALRRRPEFAVSSCPLQADEILNALESGPIHVLVMNADRGGQIDFSLLRRLQISHPHIDKILLLDTYDRGVVVNAFRSGVRGLFCFADHPFRMLCKCIQCVYDGQVWANSEQLQYLLDSLGQTSSLRVVNAKGDKLLTSREEQVVTLVADGLSNREIARELKLSEHTIKKYLFRVFDKLGISSRVELVLYAVNHGDHRDERPADAAKAISF
jgi:DNA-binding NarL/FixJ family response regulator